MTEENRSMVDQNPKTVSVSPEKFPSAVPVWRVGMVLFVCVALFAGCGGGDDPLDPRLEEALGKLESTSDTERLAGLTTLSEMGNKPKPHADKVAAVLKDTSSEVRSLAALLLGIWKHSSTEVVQELSAMATGDKDADARAAALQTLSKLGANDEFAKVVKEILAGDDADLKSETLMTIGESTSKESVTAVKAELEVIADGSDKSLAADAKIALEMIEQ